MSHELHRIYPAPPWIRWMFFSVVLLFPVLDLLAAYLYEATGWPSVVLLRYYRDAAVVVLGMAGFMQARLPYRLWLPAALYGAFLLCYALFSVAFSDLPAGLVMAALGTLLLPLSLTLAAFTAIRRAQDLALLVRMLSVYALASAGFGSWETTHTEFWTDTVNLGQYLQDIKGVATGFQPDILLPWNFVGYTMVRRAAGLLAAPLAQGFFLAVVGLAGFAYWRGRSLLLALTLALLCFDGVAESGTRGAMLAVGVGAFLYFLSPATPGRESGQNRLLLAALAVLALPVALHHLLYTVTLADGSSMGHLQALQVNLQQITRVLVVGDGVGSAGAETAAVGRDISGGGEGAIFSIAYQIGLPGAVVFLWYFTQLGRLFWAQRYAPGTTGELARALVGISVGVGVSMVTSEHLLTFSGMGAFWFLAGGYLGYLCHRPTEDA